MVPIPIKLMLDLKMRRSASITRLERSVPVREKRKIYEKSEPVIRACPRILTSARTAKSANGRISIASISGRLAIPSLIKGSGLGIIYSIAERKRHSAPRRAMFRESPDRGIDLPISFTCSLYCNKYAVRETGYPLSLRPDMPRR
jgi:hypothetical protein